MDALLATTARDDGTDPEFEELWSNVIHRTARPPPQSPALAMARTTGPSPTTESRPPAAVSTIRPLTKAPRVGTLIQRSSGNQAKKLAMLMATPPPPPHRRAKGPIQSVGPIPTKDRLTALFGDTLSDVSDDERPKEAAPPATTLQTSTSEQPDRAATSPLPSQSPTGTARDEAPVFGPTTPPPIRVNLGQGISVSVPHFAVHVSRQYKARVGERRFLLRFDHTGRCRYYREL